MDGRDEQVRRARSGRDDALWRVLRLQTPDVLMSATLNRELTEDMACFIAKSRNAPPEALGALAGDHRFKDSYELKLSLCRNPRTPQRVTIPLLRHLRIFDLSDLTRNPRLPLVLRQKVELIVEEKMSPLPAGVKTALARRASGAVVMRLMERGDRRVVEACLESPTLTEEHLNRLLTQTKPQRDLVHAIAGSPRWAARYSVRFALVRNFHTPMALVEKFIEGIKTADLQFLYDDPKLPTATRPFIHRELLRRGAPFTPAGEETYELTGEEGEEMEGLEL
jgi:hypothetical protein